MTTRGPTPRRTPRELAPCSPDRHVGLAIPILDFPREAPRSIGSPGRQHQASLGVIPKLALRSGGAADRLSLSVGASPRGELATPRTPRGRDGPYQGGRDMQAERSQSDATQRSNEAPVVQVVSPPPPHQRAASERGVVASSGAEVMQRRPNPLLAGSVASSRMPQKPARSPPISPMPETTRVEPSAQLAAAAMTPTASAPAASPPSAAGADLDEQRGARRAKSYPWQFRQLW